MLYRTAPFVGIYTAANESKAGCVHAHEKGEKDGFVSQSHSPSRRILAMVVLILSVFIQGCTRPDAPIQSWQLDKPWVQEDPMFEVVPPTSTLSHPLATYFPPTRLPDEPYATPTPDESRHPPVIRTEIEYYVVQPGDSLNRIAARFGVGAQQIITANNIPNPDILAVWQVLVIPPPLPQAPGPSFKIIPNSELVYGPASALFDLYAEVAHRGGVLAQYTEEVEGHEMSGVEVVQLVGQRYSVNPRLLLAILEYQSGWLTNKDVSLLNQNYAIGFVSAGWEGLFSQISFAANQLNHGYYLWRAGWAGPYTFSDGYVVVPGQGVNPGTVGVQYLFSQLYEVDAWRNVVGETGFYQTYLSLFGNPFDWAVEPLLPDGLEQPLMQLPFEVGKVWSFTSGPHSAWDTDAAWAALDFAPPGYYLGCVPSNDWIVAAADGLVVRTGEGEVILDIDGDGYEQTGWVLLYLHVEERDRVQPGTILQAGDRIGHASCEGGYSTGTHVHLARKYNGEWISADGPIPFVMDGWVSAGQGIAYNGTLSRGPITLEAYFRRGTNNLISR